MANVCFHIEAILLMGAQNFNETDIFSDTTRSINIINLSSYEDIS